MGRLTQTIALIAAVLFAVGLADAATPAKPTSAAPAPAAVSPAAGSDEDAAMGDDEDAVTVEDEDDTGCDDKSTKSTGKTPPCAPKHEQHSDKPIGGGTIKSP